MENIYLEDLTEGKLEVSKEIIEEVKEKCDFLKKKYNIPKEIYELLLKNRTLETNVVINDYYLYSIKEILDLRNTYPHFIDLFYTYIGMGNMLTISMCIYSNKFFTRRAGGSNGFEREENYLKYKDYKLDDSMENINVEKVIEMLSKNQLGQIPD